MQIAKKYFTEGLIQLTILLSLIGVRVDVDSYLGGYFSPLLEISLGPSSAYTQSPYHSPGDTLHGHSVHPKCPELDYYFSSRRMLDEVRSLGSPRFLPTQLDAWLVHQGPETAGPADLTDVNPGLDSTVEEDDEEGGVRHEDEDAPELCGSAAGPSLRQVDTHNPAADGAVSLSQPALEHTGLRDGTDPAAVDIDRHWSHFLSLPVSDLDDLDPLLTERFACLGPDITGAISQNVSLRDAMVTASASAPVSRQRAPPPPLFRLGSADSDPGLGAGGGCLDEAVFDQINLLGLEGLEGLEPLGTRLLEDMDSDSGLSLESSCRGSASPGTSEVSSSSSSSSSSCCEEQGGAAGYSSDGGHSPSFLLPPPSPRAPQVWHDHSYCSPLAPRSIKVEPLSEEDEEDEEEDDEEARALSRDELRARAMGLPFSALQIAGMPVEHFLSALEGRGLSAQQVALLRDIRRRGKNKLAARNCRRRKMAAISGLQGAVARLRARRDSLLAERSAAAKELGAVGRRVRQLTRDVLARLRDAAGRPLTPDGYALRCGADGRLRVQRLERTGVAAATGSKADKRKKDKKP